MIVIRLVTESAHAHRFDIGVTARLDEPAGTALAARHVHAGAIESLGQIQRQPRFAHLGWTGDQVCMRGPPLFEAASQIRHCLLMPYN